ncbi:phospholipase D-like domain-containing protein [Streptomyces sp. NPDC002073]|uniref:phospholipase D-like domain-containing protein n=1 Tax=Streptomyces sp. NBC_00239 TaxID=2903640 RepID=UPI002E2A4709|nr:phospholipase D-like domain-containing protein [Streptomyces sp. NBC_00239]
MFKKKLLPALLVGAALAVAAPSASAEPTTYVSTGPVFNDPKDPGGVKQRAILSHLGRLVGGATEGSTIRISLYAFGSSWLADQLVAAHQRNVSVQVLVDDDSVNAAWMGSSGKLVQSKLETAFAKAPAAGQQFGTSWFKKCAAGQACLAKGTGGVNHNKFFLFSRTTGSGTPTTGVPVDDVVVQSSGNLTATDSNELWNDAMTVVGNSALHAGYVSYFDRLSAASQTGPTDPLRTADLDQDVQAGPAKAYFFPRTPEDVIVNILTTVATPVTPTTPVCHGNTPGHGTADGRTVIRIANGHVSRPAVARKLWELADAGCFIDVVYGKLSDYEATGEHRETAYWLTRSTALGRITLHRLNNNDHKDPLSGAAGTASHTKYLLVEGAYKGLKDQKITFTGSHTFTGLALTANDETLLKYEDAAVHDAYRDNFRAQRAAAAAEDGYGGAL